MSLVNDMLRDLDERRRDAPTRGLGAEKLVPASKTSVSRSSRSAILILAVVVAAALVVVLAWVMTSRSAQQPQSMAPVQMRAPAAAANDGISADATSTAISELEQRLRQLEEQNQALIARQAGNQQATDTLSIASGSGITGSNMSGSGQPVITQARPEQSWQPRIWESEAETETELDVSASVNAILESAQPTVMGADVLDNVAQQVASEFAGQQDAGASARGSQSTPASTSVADVASVSRQATSPGAGQAPASTVRSPREPSFADRDRQQVRLALEQWQAGQQLAALQSLDEFTFQFPEAHASRETLAKLLIQQGETDRATLVIDIGLRIAPNNNEYRKIKARLLISDRSPEAAAQLLSASAPAVAVDSEYHDLLATAYLSSGQYTDAVMAYQLLLQNDAQVGRWWYGLAASLDAISRLGEAAQAYERALQMGDLSATLRQASQQRLLDIRQATRL